MDGEKARKLIEDRIGKLSDKDVCGAFMIDLDNSREINELMGREEENRAVVRAGQLLSALFSAPDIVCRIGRDEFLVFSARGVTHREMFQKAQEICRKLSFPVKGDQAELQVTVCVGAYVATGKELSFDILFGQTAAALFEARKDGRGSCCLLTDETEVRKREKRRNLQKLDGIATDTLISYLNGGVALLEAGPEIRVIYASSGFFRMLGITAGRLILPCSLENIGIHPDHIAEYMQVVRDTAEKKETAEHIHRISGDGRNWIWRQARVSRIAYPASEYPVVLELSTDVTDLIRTESELEESNERLRVAFGQTPHLMWEVDIEKRTYNTFNVREQCCCPETVVEGFPESFIENGIVHPNSRTEFRKFAEDLLSGKRGDTGNFVIKDQVSDCYSWVSLSYRMTYNRDKEPVKAVGIQRKLPGMSRIGRMAVPVRSVPGILRHHLLLRLKVNLTQDYVNELWYKGLDQTSWTWGKTYASLVERWSKEIFTKTDVQDFKDLFNRSYLLKCYREGRWWLTWDGRRVDEGGDIRWSQCTINLTADSEQKNVYMFACCTDAQQKYDWEKLAGGELEHHPESGLYTLKSVRRLAECLVRQGGASDCALSVVHILGKRDRKKDSFPALYRFIAIALSFALGGECVTGQDSADSITVFFPRAVSRFDIKRRFEDAFAYIRTSMENIPEIGDLRFVAGTVLERTGEADYDILNLRAGYLCEIWKDSAVDTVMFPSEDEDWAWAGLRKENSGQEIFVQEEEPDRALTKEEQRSAFYCTTNMLKAKSLEESLGNALSCIGMYYNAVRAYIVALSEDGRTVTMLYEWKQLGKQSIQHAMSGIEIEKVPLLNRCMEKGVPVYMENNAPFWGCRNDEDNWNVLAYPLRERGRITGFLCVENAGEYIGDVTLIRTLVPYILGEQKRFDSMNGGAPAAGQDILTMMPNLNSYMDVVYSLNSDSYSTMGALSVDVPNFSAINSTFGFEYGRKFLQFIADTLLSIFGKTFIFRTWDAEFVVLAPNMIREVFDGRCARLRTALQRRYPKQVRIGYVWSDGVFSARNLVREAQAIMHCENVKQASGGRTDFLDGTDEFSTAEISSRKFVPYFQPKIDMRDGSLIGAEALVRGVSEDGTVIPPVRFVEAMEKDGTIRELDLFMLESVLKQLSVWRRMGLPPVTVSVNMSRHTLFNSTVFASVLALQSRYPDVPPEQIELEITETAGDMEKATLACIVDNFRECGIQFELDDFGSGYANISIFSNIRFHTIKLDRSLINDLPDNEISRMLVEKIVQVCHNFGMTCVAEGVETARQETVLLNSGCNFGQGYRYARPMSAAEFEIRYLGRHGEN